MTIVPRRTRRSHRRRPPARSRARTPAVARRRPQHVSQEEEPVPSTALRSRVPPRATPPARRSSEPRSRSARRMLSRAITHTCRDDAPCHHRRGRGRDVGGDPDPRRRPRRPRSSCWRQAASRATRRAASRSSSVASWPAGSRRSSPDAGRAPPARHRRAHPPRGDGHRPRRRRGRVARRARRRVVRLGYDELLIATGGAPIRPDLPGIDLPFVHGVQTLDDAQAAGARRGCRRSSSSAAATSAWRWPRRYIERGCTATVVEQGRSRSASSTPTSAGGSPRRMRVTASTSAAGSGSRASSPGRC